MKKDMVIISVGGSLIVPSEIDVSFLKRFRKLILDYVALGGKAIIICGGGKTSRKYQEAARQITALKNEDVDWLGIQGTKINAYLIKTIFKEKAHPEIIDNPTKKINFKEKILVACGWKPGCSTDYDAVVLAKKFNIKKIINLTNIDYVYDKDPKKFRDAKPIKEILWKDFRKLLPKKWSPGLNVPFDPIAAKIAQKFNMEAAIIDGRNLKNLENCLKDKKFVGTMIK
ncbi:MAG: UMP kinase [Candidatus Pacearchaeota archaeon]|nr:UMP kinase [Candidatus Pacearchaeota archaeon]